MPAAASTLSSIRNYRVEYSINGTVWVDWSPWVTGVMFSGGDIAIGEHLPFDALTPTPVPGKGSMQQVVISIPYTEGVTDPFPIMRIAQFAPDPLIRLRFSPRGGQTGESIFTLVDAFVVSGCNPPSGASNDATPMMVDVTVAFASFTVTVAV